MLFVRSKPHSNRFKQYATKYHQKPSHFTKQKYIVFFPLFPVDKSFIMIILDRYVKPLNSSMYVLGMKLVYS